MIPLRETIGRTVAALLIGILLGAAGAAGARQLAESESTPSLYTNANGAQALQSPDQHIAAAVQYRGIVLASHPVHGGIVVAMRIDGTLVAAHIYDPSWAPAHRGQPLEIQGRIRGSLGDPIQAIGIPIFPPLARGATLVDVSATGGPHRERNLKLIH